MVSSHPPFVHIEHPNQGHLKPALFESMRVSFCGQWFPYKSPAWATWAPMGGVACPDCKNAADQFLKDNQLGLL